MAVAQAQHAVRELANVLEKRGVDVNYAIHPVAGRMPGHMNVLLAEADIPYEQLKEMDEINAEMQQIDVAIVIGANDVVNPVAKDDPKSPIAGMPIIEVDKAQQVIVIKRSLSPGFAGIDNDLFYDDKTSMLFADAKRRRVRHRRAGRGAVSRLAFLLAAIVTAAGKKTALAETAPGDQRHSLRHREALGVGETWDVRLGDQDELAAGGDQLAEIGNPVGSGRA